jgi:hypothetical protein
MTAAEQSYYNSEVDQRGYAFKINSRLRKSTAAVTQKSLWSATSESRFAKTNLSFGNCASQGVLRFRVDNHAVELKANRLTDSKGFYVDRLNEREMRQPATEEVDEVPAIIENQEQDVFDQWQREHPEDNEKTHHFDLYGNEHDLDPMSEAGGVTMPIPRSNLRNTTQDYFKDYHRKEEVVPFMPRVQSLGNGNMRKAIIRTSSSKFFNSMATDADKFQSRKISNARSTTSLAMPTSGANKLMPRLARYSRLQLKVVDESNHQLLTLRATQDAAREYEDIAHVKARLGTASSRQSVASLRRALLTPDTGFYTDITSLPIPSNGSRLIAYEPPVPPKIRRTKNDKSKSKK